MQNEITTTQLPTPLELAHLAAAIPPGPDEDRLRINETIEDRMLARALRLFLNADRTRQEAQTILDNPTHGERFKHMFLDSGWPMNTCLITNENTIPFDEGLSQLNIKAPTLRRLVARMQRPVVTDGEWKSASPSNKAVEAVIGNWTMNGFRQHELDSIIWFRRGERSEQGRKNRLSKAKSKG